MNFEDFKLKYQKKEVLEELNEVPKTPLVSVLVQTYQHVDYIKMCLDSILMQKTNFEFEIILGEDASDDGTREICLNYAKQYPNKIRLFLHYRENNIHIGGSPTGRFILLYNLISARGNYVALCEGDDYWTDPLKLQKQVDFLENNSDYVLVHHDAKIINEQGELVKESKLPNNFKKDLSSLELQQGPFLLTLSLCFRNLIKEYQEFTGGLNGDKILLSLLGVYGKGKYQEEVRPAAYRIHEMGIWSSLNTEKKLFALINTYRKLSQYYERKGNDELHLFFENKQKTELLKILKLNFYEQDFAKYLINARFYFTNSKDSKFVKAKVLLKTTILSTGGLIKRKWRLKNNVK